MPIKKSYLEQKWYYRVAKVFLWVLPFLVIAIMFLRVGGNILDILEKNIVYIAIGLVLYLLILKIIWRVFLYIGFGGLEDDTKKKGSETIQSAAQPAPVRPKSKLGLLIPLILFAGVFITAILVQTGYITLPRINLNSGQFNPIESHAYGTSCTTSDGKTGLYGTNGDCYTCSEGTAVTNPINNNCSNGIAGVYCCGTTNNGDNNGNDGCISTGCGSMWYCSGYYYIGGQEINVPGLCFPTHPRNVYPSWVGTCRQCP